MVNEALQTKRVRGKGVAQTTRHAHCHTHERIAMSIYQESKTFSTKNDFSGEQVNVSCLALRVAEAVL